MSAATSAPFEYVFPAISGVQAGREYYVSMCPMRLIPKIFLFDEEELLPELRAQRVLNRSRVPVIARYILDNKKDYIFSALTASIDADVRFEPITQSGEASRIGVLHIPMSAKFIINDGQHRRAAIEMALREDHDVGNESIAIVFFLDVGLKRSQQMFADLNRYAIRPSKSIGVLYDHRDDKAELTRLVVLRTALFRDVVEMERSTLSARSRKLFTLSAIYTATTALLEGQQVEREQAVSVGICYWDEIAKHFPEWQLVRDHKMTAGEVREKYIHSHGIVLLALGRIGKVLIAKYPNGWQKRLRPLERINWLRSNAIEWEGRTLVGGRVTKSEQNVVLTGNLIKKHLNIELSPDEQRLEDAFARSNGRKTEAT